MEPGRRVVRTLLALLVQILPDFECGGAAMEPEIRTAQRIAEVVVRGPSHANLVNQLVRL